MLVLDAICTLINARISYIDYRPLKLCYFLKQNSGA